MTSFSMLVGISDLFKSRINIVFFSGGIAKRSISTGILSAMFLMISGTVMLTSKASSSKLLLPLIIVQLLINPSTINNIKNIDESFDKMLKYWTDKNLFYKKGCERNIEEMKLNLGVFKNMVSSDSF